MSRKTFLLIAGPIFAAVALVHLLRLAMGWPVTIALWAVPMWLSWFGLFVAGGLSYLGLRLAARE